MTIKHIVSSEFIYHALDSYWHSCVANLPELDCPASRSLKDIFIKKVSEIGIGEFKRSSDIIFKYLINGEFVSRYNDTYIWLPENDDCKDQELDNLWGRILQGKLFRP